MQLQVQVKAWHHARLQKFVRPCLAHTEPTLVLVLLVHTAPKTVGEKH